VRVREVIPGISELIISHLTVDDVGLYECRTVNHVGSDVRSATVDVGCEYIRVKIHLSTGHLEYLIRRAVDRPD